MDFTGHLCIQCVSTIPIMRLGIIKASFASSLDLHYFDAGASKISCASE